MICRSFPHHRPGGMEWHAQDVADGLMEAGHTVSAFTTPLPEKPALRKLALNGSLLEFGSAPGRYDFWFLSDFFRLAADQVARLRPDIIHAQGFAGIAASRYLGREIPLVTTIHGTLWSETAVRGLDPSEISLARQLSLWWRYKHRHLLEPLWTSFLQSDPNLITDSEFTIAELEREVGKLPRRPWVVPLGFDLGRFRPNPEGRPARRAVWTDGKDGPLLATVGRLEPMKRPRLLARAFAAVAADFPKARFVIAGSGSELEPLRRLDCIDSLLREGRVQFPGPLDPLRMTSLLEAADLFLNGDHGAPAFGLANAEALVMGTPVLAFDTGAHREVVRDDLDGFLVAPAQEEEFVARLRTLLSALPESEDRRAERAARARQRFSRERMVAELTAVFTAVGGDRKR